MGLSLKRQHAVRVLFEFARRYGDTVVRLRDIAEAQRIPGAISKTSCPIRGGAGWSSRGAERMAASASPAAASS